MSTLENIDRKYRRDSILDDDTFKFFTDNLDTSFANSYQLELPKIKTPNNPYVQYSQFDHDLWANENDFVNSDNQEDDIDLIHTQINTLFEDVLYIINENIIEEHDLDHHFKVYLKFSSDAIQVMMNNMFENKWTFDPMQKFMWIYLMIACKYEPRAVKYLLNSAFYSPELMIQKDKHGYSPLFHAVCNPDFIDLQVIKDYLTVENLGELYFNSNVLINYAIKNKQTMKYIIENVDISKINYSTSKYNILLLACAYDEELVELILSKNSAENNLMEMTDHENTSCLFYSLVYTPNKFSYLLESEFCNQDIVSKTHKYFGNILLLSLKINHDIFKQILSSKFMNETLFKDKIKYKSGVYTNLFLELCKNEELFIKLIESDHLNKLDVIFNDINILVEISHHSSNIIKKLIDGKILTREQVLETDSSDINLLFYSALSNISIFHNIYHSYLWNDDFLKLRFKNFSRNLLMIMSEYCPNENGYIKDLYNKGLFSDVDLLSETDENNYNIFWYICTFNYDVAIEYIQNNKSMIKNFLNDKVLRSFAYNYFNGYNTIFDYVFNKVNLDSTMIGDVDEYQNNFLMEVSIYNPKLIKKIFDLPNIINFEMISQTNNNNDNVLTLLLKNQFSADLFEALELIINSPYIDQYIIGHKNNSYESPFLLACRTNYNCVKLITESKYFNNDNFFDKNCLGENCFVYACQSKDLEMIKIICDNPLFEESMFTSYDSNYIPNIYYAMISNSDIAKYVLTHKYCNKEILCDSFKIIMNRRKLTSQLINIILDLDICDSTILEIKDLHGRNCLNFAAKNNDIDLLKKILDSNHLTEEIFCNLDYEGQTILYYTKDPDMINMINDYGYLEKIVHLKNNSGKNVLNYYIEDNLYYLFIILLRTHKCSINMLSHEYEDDKSILLNLFSLGDILIEEILSLPYLTKDDLLCSDKNGNTCLHNMAIYTLNNMMVGNLNQNNDLINDHLQKVSKYINCDKFSNELLIKQNSEGATFLLLNPFLIDIILESKYCSHELLKIKDKYGNDLLLKLCYSNHYASQLNNFINSDMCKADLLFDDSDNTNILASLCIDPLKGWALESIIKSKSCNADLINVIDKVGFTPLVYAILSSNYNHIDLILNSNFDLTPTFEKNYDDKNLLMIAASKDFEIFKIIFKSKFMTKDLLLQQDKYGHNVVIQSVSKNVSVIKTIIESNFWDDELKYITDVDNDPLMLFAYNYPEINQYLLSSGKCDKKMMEIPNNFGKNCSHYYIKNEESMANLLNAETLCSDQLLQQQDKLGNTCLHYACLENIKSTREILKSNYNVKELLMIQNNKGETPIMILLKENSKSIPYKLLFKYIDSNEIIDKKDHKGDNIIFYSIKYDLRFLKFLLKYNLITKDNLVEVNKKGFNCYLFAAKYNGDAIKFLLKHKEYEENMLSHSHMDYGSCLTMAARYQPSALKYLLKSNISWKLLHTTYKKMNFLQIAATYNSESMKIAIDSPVNLNDLLSYSEPAFTIACRYQPDAVKYILDSKYATKSMIVERIGTREAILEAADYQPKALGYILKSKFGDVDMLYIEDERGYRLIYNLRSVYPHISIENFDQISLMKYDNELAGKKDKVCNICYTYKPSIIISPCCHMCCIGCAFKLSNCHMCRADIEDRIIVYE